MNKHTKSQPRILCEPNTSWDSVLLAEAADCEVTRVSLGVAMIQTTSSEPRLLAYIACTATAELGHQITQLPLLLSTTMN